MKSYFWNDKAVYYFVYQNIMVKEGLQSSNHKWGIWN